MIYLTEDSVVLFVCGGNLVRSPAAATLFEQKFGLTAYSAGTQCEDGREMILFTLRGLERYGCSVEGQRTRRLTYGLASDADRIIVLMEEDEASAGLPDYLREDGKLGHKTVLWEVPDPFSGDDARVYDVFDEIERRVEVLGEMFYV